MAQMFTCEEVAERYKVKVITVWEWIRQKKTWGNQVRKRIQDHRG